MQDLLPIIILLFAVFFLQSNDISANSLSWKLGYDDQDRIINSEDPAGRVTEFTYTPSKGPVKEIAVIPPEGKPVTWRIADEGKLAAMHDGEGEVAYGYDQIGRLESVERKGAAAIRYRYDGADRLSEIKVGDFYRIAWTYDFLGRISSLDTPAGIIRYGYQTGQNTVIRTLPNGVKTFWKRQPNGQLEEITHGYSKKPGDSSCAVLAQYKYTHGPDGRIAAISERSAKGEFARRYTYDTMGRLTDATGPAGQKYHYEYDQVGGRTKATATGQPDQVSSHDWAGRLTSVDGKPCSYDATGNLSEINLGGVTHQYRYHPDGRLAEARMGSDTVQYRYDGFGRLLSRKTTSSETRFIPDPLSPYWQPLVMEEAGGARALVIWDGSTPLALVRNGSVEWLLHDHLGSVRLMANAKGGVIRYGDFDPYGVPAGDTQSATLSPGYAGLFLDSLAGGYFTMARALAPKLGKFLQPDPQKNVPMPEAKILSPYVYCGGDPANYYDRNGLYPENYDMTMDSILHNLTIWENQQRTKWSSEILSDFPTYTEIPGQINVNKKISHAYSKYVDRTVASYLKFGDVAGVAENYLRSLRNIPRTTIPLPLRDPTNASSIAVRGASLYRAIASTAFTILEGIGAGVQYLDLTTGSMMAYSPPLYLNRKTSWGWEGAGTIRMRNITWNYAETLNTSAPRWWEPGQIARHHQDWIHTQFGTVERTIDNVTPATTPFERFIMHHRPLGDYYDPQQSRITTTIRSHQEYQVTSKSRPESYWTEEQYLSDGGRTITMTPLQSPPPPPPPSPVGGIYLGGAGSALDGLGMLKGVQTDANGNLLLIGEDNAGISMPPLRLDDVVTVFRSVYLHGEGPTVTIDPNPENPEQSAMIIRHGKATEGTYVGWILYQADRLMKSYCQGKDNKTEKDVESRVADYADILDTIYFGGTEPRKAQKEGVWERFWIVPAEANRFNGPCRALTLFDVPLKVKTQKMKWEKDKLVDDTKGKSSPGAAAFTAWFTEKYDHIAAEQFLTPPPETGLTGPVPVFSELRRIALLTAVAEKLRDQGVAMPFWMRDYEVREVPFEQFTPGMEVTRERQQGNVTQTARIFGGVELSPETNAVKTYITEADAAKAPQKKHGEVVQAIRLASSLEGQVASQVPTVLQEPLSVHQVRDGKRSFQAVPVPGAETRALGPCRLDEVDLAIPLEGGREIRLVRSFNSFFDPKGPWGRGWAFDLPRLEEIRIPTGRDGNKAFYYIAYELLTPLNSLSARFREVKQVPELGRATMMVADAEGPFYGLTNMQPDFLKKTTTRMLLLKDGRQWHFTPQGDLVAVIDGPQVTVYERDPQGRLSGMVALLGGQIAGRIALEYTQDGRLAKATGSLPGNSQSKPLVISYAYDDAGRLAGVSSEEGTVGYRYDGAKLNAVTWQDKEGKQQAEVLRSFTYDAAGRVLSQKSGDDTVDYSISVDPAGIIASSQVRGKDNTPTQPAAVRYDLRMRPVEMKAADGPAIRWSYPEAGGAEMTITESNGKPIVIIDSADGCKRTFRQDGTPQITANFDPGGRLSTLSEGDQVVLSQEWRPDGQLSRSATPGQGATFEYDGHGVLSGMILHPPKAGEKLAEWQNTKLDRKGRPVEVTDFKGMKVLLGYDASGGLSSVVQQTPEGNRGYEVQRDDQGRIKAVKSSWGETAYTYDKEGSLERINGKSHNKSASVAFQSGRVQATTGFDGGRTSFAYEENGPAAGMPRTITCPNGLALHYGYAASGDLATVKVGADRLVRLEYDKQGRVTSYAWEPVPQ